MAQAADRMRAMRERRRAQGIRELRLVVPDARSEVVLRRVARQVAHLNQAAEREAIQRVESVSEWDIR